MKKQLLSLIALCAIAGASHAQSSVTLYGTVDLALRRVQTGDAQMNELGNSGANSSALGYKGREDLGDGLYAGFKLESDLLMNSGTVGTPFFGRESWINIGNRFGEVRLGRDYVPTFSILAAYDPFGNVGVAASGNVANYGLNTNATVSSIVRSANSISYTTPDSLGGFFAKVQGAPSEGVSGGNYNGGDVGYASGPVRIVAALGITNVGVAGSTVNTGTLKQRGVTGTYDFGVVDLRLQYMERASDVGGGLKQSNLIFAGVVPIGLGQIKFKYIKVSQDVDASLAAIGYLYNLSKRTALYATYSVIQNKNANAHFTVDGSIPAIAGLNQRSSGLDLGIRQTF